MSSLDPNYELNRIQELIHVYKPQITTIRENIKGKIATKKYGNDGLCLHRGFYCPSKIVDVISNADRGRLAEQRHHKRTKFHYGFDQFENLIFVKQGAEEEFILRNPGVELGLTIRAGKIQRVSECVWNEDGRLEKYSLFQLFDKIIKEYSIERYIYTSDRVLVEIDGYVNAEGQCSFIEEKSFLTKENYVFVVEEGKLKKYWPEQRSEMVYDVFVDRAID